MFLFTFNEPIQNWCRIDKKQGLSSALSQIMKKYVVFFIIIIRNG